MSDKKIGFAPEEDEPEVEEYTFLQIFLQIIWDRWSGGLGWGLFLGLLLGSIL